MKKRLIRAGAVLAVALAAGHLVQTMNAEKAQQATTKPKSVEQVSAGADATAPAPKASPAPTVPAAASLTGTPATAPATAMKPEEKATAAAAPAPAAATAPALTAEAPAPKADPASTVKEEPKLAALTDGTAALPEASKPATLSPADPAPVAEAPKATEPAAPAAVAGACTTDFSLAPGPQATIAVTITAPCRANERVVLRHAGLALAESLDAKGVLKLDIPAMKETGEVSALFADAEVERGSVPMPDVKTMTRFAVQWMADDAFQLHGMENGATYGQPGHVSAGSPVSPNGGYLMMLGNPALDMPMMAEVYTFPTDPKIKSEIIVEAAVTELTCGRELLGETILSRAGSVEVTDLSLATPDCDALGDILVLKNLLPDLTLAAN